MPNGLTAPSEKGDGSSLIMLAMQLSSTGALSLVVVKAPFASVLLSSRGRIPALVSMSLDEFSLTGEAVVLPSTVLVVKGSLGVSLYLDQIQEWSQDFRRVRSLSQSVANRAKATSVVCGI